MTDNEIQQKVLQILKPFVKNEEMFNNAGPQTKLLEDLAINSARLVDILLEFEDAFDVEIHDDDADRARTLGDVVSMLSEKVAA